MACCKSLLYLPTKNLRSEAIIVTFQNAFTDIDNLLRVRIARLDPDCFSSTSSNFVADQDTTFPSTTKRPPAPPKKGVEDHSCDRPNSRIRVKSRSSDHVPLHAVQECAVLDCHHKLLYPKHDFEECQRSGRGWQPNSNGGRVSSVIVRCTTRGCTDKFKLVQSTLVPRWPFRKHNENLKVVKSRTRHATSHLRRVSVPPTSEGQWYVPKCIHMFQFLTRAQRMFVQHIHVSKTTSVARGSGHNEPETTRSRLHPYLHICGKARRRSTFVVQHATNGTSAGKNRKGETNQ